MLNIILSMFQTIAAGLVPVVLAWALPIFSADKKWANYLDVFNRYRNAVEESDDEVISLTLLERMQSIGFIIYGRKMFVDEVGRQYPAAIFISLVYYLTVVIGVDLTNENINYQMHVITAAVCILIFLVAFILSIIMIQTKYSNRRAEYSALFDNYRDRQLCRIKGETYCGETKEFDLSLNERYYLSQLNAAGHKRVLSKILSISNKKKYQKQ